MVELASGTGLPSLAAHCCGARVTSTDLSPLARQLVLAASKQPATAGAMSIGVFDLLKDSPERLLEMRPDIVVASDVLYEESFAEALGQHLGAAARSGAAVITTDPGRMQGRGQEVFLDSFFRAAALDPAAVDAQFRKRDIPDHVLDRGLSAMKYGGQVDRSVGVFEFCGKGSTKSFARGVYYIDVRGFPRLHFARHRFGDSDWC